MKTLLATLLLIFYQTISAQTIIRLDSSASPDGFLKIRKKAAENESRFYIKIGLKNGISSSVWNLSKFDLDIERYRPITLEVNTPGGEESRTAYSGGVSFEILKSGIKRNIVSMQIELLYSGKGSFKHRILDNHQGNILDQTERFNFNYLGPAEKVF